MALLLGAEDPVTLDGVDFFLFAHVTKVVHLRCYLSCRQDLGGQHSAYKPC